MIITYAGPELGTGASYSWTSDDPAAGNGKLTIIESIPYSLIKTEIDFMERGTANAEYRFHAEEGGTMMTWSMKSDMGNNPIGRYMGLFMDKWLGNDFEKGMAKL
ncbi:MAG: SRPBCC family protein [Bacteroidales bacterium]|nr:SRPBCC family protein [Bacteroidales bacterium]